MTVHTYDDEAMENTKFKFEIFSETSIFCNNNKMDLFSTNQDTLFASIVSGGFDMYKVTNRD